jgi:4-alpha-glucanotransferase
MSTIRGWWEEDRSKTQKFFNEELGQWGDAPFFCDAWINKAIVQQHLHSPAMWSIFQLQDLLGMDENIRRENPNDERINVPRVCGRKGSGKRRRDAEGSGVSVSARTARIGLGQVET